MDIRDHWADDVESKEMARFHVLIDDFILFICTNAARKERPPCK